MVEHGDDAEHVDAEDEFAVLRTLQLHGQVGSRDPWDDIRTYVDGTMTHRG